MRKIIFAALVGLTATEANAQNAGALTLPQDSVLGRLGSGPGRAQAIPISRLAGRMLVTGNACPTTTLQRYQWFANTASSPSATSLNIFDGSQCVVVGTLDESAHTFSFSLGSLTTVGTLTTGTWHATPIEVTYGGTGVSLAATGGTSQFLRQASTGANITVVRPACADLSNPSAFCSNTDAADLTGTVLSARMSGTYTGIFIPRANVVVTTTNDNAAAGTLGEYTQSEILVANIVSLTTATAKTITSISLTAGDWDVCGAIAFGANALTTSTVFASGISTVDNTLPTNPPSGGAYYQVTATNGNNWLGAQTPLTPIGCRRASLSGTTVYYLVAYSAFAVNTMGAYGIIKARRVR